MSVIFLPGVIIHELSHLLTAIILFVRVGDMEFMPKREGDGLKLGSVEIARTDPLRRSLIGFAPVFVGFLLVVGVVYFFTSNFLFFQNKNIYIFIAAIFVLVYLLFAISNTMFASRRDMEGTVEVLIVLTIIFLGFYVFGFRPSLSDLNKIFTKGFVGIIQKSGLFLLAPIIIDLLILGSIALFTSRRSRIW
jgi:hypothetical protein